MKRARRARAFTLLELLVVIGIIGLLATLGIGALRGFNATNVVAAGNRQLLDDITMARNHAQNQRTTVYMVFVPPLKDIFPLVTRPEDKVQFTNRLGGQLTSYNFVTLRAPGDQPGQGKARYLSEWKHLPDGVFVSPQEFTLLPAKDWQDLASAAGSTNLPLPRILVPFPTSKSERVEMPCIAFSYRGELLGPLADKPRRKDEVLTLTRGSIIYPKDDKGKALLDEPETIETPRGNLTNNPYIRIDWITGRARLEEPKS